MNNLIDAGFRLACYRPEMNFGRFGRLVVAVDAGEIFEFPAPRFGIESFDVAALTLLQRRVHEDFDELAVLEQAARQLALRAKWRNKGDKHNQPRIHQQFRDLGHPANVFHPVGRGARLSIDYFVNTPASFSSVSLSLWV